MAEFLSQMGMVEDGIVEAFEKGGGVPYSGFPKFQRQMAALSAQIFDATLIEVTLPLVAGLSDRLRAGIDVADVGCGQGHAINLMAKAFPDSRFIGYDFSDGGCGRRADRGADDGTLERDVRAEGRVLARRERRASTSSRRSTPSTTRRTRARC